MMEDFEEAQSIGELLRNARLKKGKTLGDVSKDLCIRKFYLEAIENLEIKNLPPMPYGLGFVRSYAEYLNMNSTRVVQAFRQVAYPPEETKKENREPAAEKENMVIDYTGPHLRHILIGLIGIVAIFAVWSGISSYNQSKQIAEEKETLESDVVPEPVIIEDSDSPVEETGMEEPENSAENKEIPAEEKTEQNEAPAAQPSEDASTAVSRNQDETTKAAAETKAGQKPAESKTEPAPAENAVAAARMHISLAGPSWLELRQGSRILLSGIYGKGFQYDVPNEAGMVISVGRYYNVDFYVDGKLTKIASAMKQTNISLDKYILPEQKQE